jgi:chemotaxis protein MotB
MYDILAAERDQLARENAGLDKALERAQASNASLASERFDLIDAMEDLRLEHGELSADVERLRLLEAELSSNLASREAELSEKRQVLDQLSGTYAGLVEDLEAEVAAGQIQIEQLREGLRLNLSQEILFSSGSSTLNPRGQEVLRAVAGRLQSVPNAVEVQGHTDNVALHPSARYPSNWELAAARAANVVRLFVEAGMTAERFTVVSFGEFAPIASNDTPEGRAQNRRIEIRLKPGPGSAGAAVGSVGEAGEAAAAEPAAEAEAFETQ